MATTDKTPIEPVKPNEEFYLGPSKEQLEATGEAPEPPEDLVKATKGEKVEFRSEPEFLFEGGTAEQPSCFDEVNEELKGKDAKTPEPAKDSETPRRSRFSE